MPLSAVLRSAPSFARSFGNGCPETPYKLQRKLYRNRTAPLVLLVLASASSPTPAFSICSCSYPVRANPLVSGAVTTGFTSPAISGACCCRGATGSPRCAISSMARSIGIRHLALATGRSSCSSPAADLRARADRLDLLVAVIGLQPRRGKRAASVAQTCSASPGSMPGCPAGAHPPAWFHLRVGPSSLSSSALITLPMPIAEHPDHRHKDAPARSERPQSR